MPELDGQGSQTVAGQKTVETAKGIAYLLLECCAAQGLIR
jgi:hypothetical protein